MVRVGEGRGRLRHVHALTGEKGRAGGEPLARECPVVLASRASAQDEYSSETDDEEEKAADK